MQNRSVTADWNEAVVWLLPKFMHILFSFDSSIKYSQSQCLAISDKKWNTLQAFLGRV